MHLQNIDKVFKMQNNYHEMEGILHAGNQAATL